MSPEEINKKAYEKYPVAMDQRTDSLGFGDFNAPPRQGYIDAYKEISSLPTIKGWLARDGFGQLAFSSKKPKRLGLWKLWKVSSDTPAVVLPNSLFNDLRWEDKPIEVELLIIRK